MTDIKPLLSIVEAATGPDRTLDAKLACFFIFTASQPAQHIPGTIIVGSFFHRSDPYTSSIDSAVALIERVMPGHGWLLAFGRHGDDEWGGQIFSGRRIGSLPLATEEAPTAPLCLLKLLLRAKIAESEAS